MNTTDDHQAGQPLGLASTEGLGAGSEARTSLYEHGLSWALVQSFACTDDAAQWTTDDIARAFEAGAKAMQAASARNMPEPVERLMRYAGKTMRTARNPNLTAREAIEVGNWIAANARIGA